MRLHLSSHLKGWVLSALADAWWNVMQGQAPQVKDPGKDPGKDK